MLIAIPSTPLRANVLRATTRSSECRSSTSSAAPAAMTIAFAPAPGAMTALDASGPGERHGLGDGDGAVAHPSASRPPAKSD
ncbi:MAG TPA: hypothetical protein VK279_14225 [Solirubrobacteraceae bacterium]|nr:hypothetical protein [Solirubrobacteraceae bacterium]